MRYLRCPRCGGNLLTEPDAGGYIIELRCMACHRLAGEHLASDLASDLKSPADARRAASGSHPIWISGS